MFRPLTLRRSLFYILFCVLLGVAFVAIAKASEPGAPMAVSAPAVMSSGICGEESDDCYALIYTPGICELVVRFGYWYYAFYCDQREGGRLMADDAILYTELPDGSVVVELFRIDGERRIHMIRFLPARVKR